MKEKFLNVIIIVLLSILLINTFSWENDVKKSSWILEFTLNENSFSIPASPVLNIKNNSWTGVVLNTCNDLNVNYWWEKIVFWENFCEDIKVDANSVSQIQFNEYYGKFDKIGVYNFIVTIDNKDYISQAEVENKGSISKLFVTLFYAPLYNLTVYFINIFGNSLGWAIVAITIFIRVLLLYPQHKMMISQRKLQAIQPKIKDIQAKHKGNSQLLWMEMMKLYKEEKVNPFWSCGLLLIQMPILLVVYRIFINIKDYSNAYYLYDYLKNFNLDAVWHLFFWIDLLWVGGLSWIILWLSIAIIQYIQVKLSLVHNNINNKWIVLEKKKDTKDYNSFMPDPEILNKFMLYWLPVMVWVFTYSLLAWVWIYWWISTTFTIFQQLIVNKIVKK